MKTTFIFLLLTTIAYTQNYNNELYGWDKATWGMTRDQIMRLYDTYDLRNGDTLKIDRYNLLNLQFNISFIFLDDTLTSVRLQCKDNGLGISQFNKFEEGLVTKYGKYVYKNEEGENDKLAPHIIKSKWILSKTNIELAYVGISILNTYSIILQYSAPTIIKGL